MKIIVVIGVAALLAARPASAEHPPTLECGQPTVLTLLADTLRQAGQRVVVEAASAGQIPGAAAGTVLCAVRIHRVAFDTNHFGATPIDQVSLYTYRLDLRHNGIFLSPG